MGGAQGNFRKVQLFGMTPRWWIHGIIHLVKPVEWPTQSMDANENEEYWIIVVANPPALPSDITNGEQWGRVDGNSRASHSIFP